MKDVKMIQTTDKLPILGYKLLNLGSHWELKSPRGTFRGDLKKVCAYAVNTLGFQFQELNLAVNEMEKQFHDGSEFGMYKSFIFTFEIKEQNDERTKIH